MNIVSKSSVKLKTVIMNNNVVIFIATVYTEYKIENFDIDFTLVEHFHLLEIHCFTKSENASN